jgi:hypothetical protein
MDENIKTSAPEGLSLLCTRDKKYWKTKDNLIFRRIVVKCPVRRVMRQFGLYQSPLSISEQEEEQHEEKRPHTDEAFLENLQWYKEQTRLRVAYMSEYPSMVQKDQTLSRAVSVSIPFFSCLYWYHNLLITQHNFFCWQIDTIKWISEEMASCNENNWNTVISAVMKKCDDFMCHHTLLQPTPLDIEATNFGVTDEQDHPTNDGQSEKGDRQTDIVYQKRNVQQDSHGPGRAT